MNLRFIGHVRLIPDLTNIAPQQSTRQSGLPSVCVGDQAYCYRSLVNVGHRLIIITEKLQGNPDFIPLDELS